MKNALLFGLSMLVMMGCKKDTPQMESDYQIGKNRYTTMIDGDEREYYVHVPDTYDPADKTPVVIFLHGTGGQGDRPYGNSGWVKLANKENILAVFPSSWRYCIIEDGGQEMSFKWNTYPLEFCPGENPKDDIGFLKQMITELKQKFAIDDKRIYLVGFSNGGGMAFRCAVEMSDIFAAVVEASGAYSGDSIFVPKRKIPISYQIGNMDKKYFNSTFPMRGFLHLVDSSEYFNGIVQANIRIFGFESSYTVSGDTANVITATYQGLGGADREFRFSLIKGLGHFYPTGKGHPFKAAEENWAWMKQYILP